MNFNIRDLQDPRSREFILICGGILSLISFMLSFLQVTDDYFFYNYYIYLYLLTILIAGSMFDRGKMIALATVFSILHLIFVYFFYPLVPSLSNMSSPVVNVFLILFYYVFGLTATRFRDFFQQLLEQEKNNQYQLQKEITRLKDDAHKSTHTTMVKDDLFMEKKQVRFAAYFQIFEEMLKSLARGRKDILQHITSVMQTRLKIESAELYYLDPVSGWKLVHRSGRSPGSLDQSVKKSFCQAAIDEKAPVATCSETIHKYRIEVEADAGVIALPIIISESARSVILMEGFKDLQLITEDERFCTRISSSISKGEA